MATKDINIPSPAMLIDLAESNDWDSEQIDEGCPPIGGKLRECAKAWKREVKTKDRMIVRRERQMALELCRCGPAWEPDTSEHDDECPYVVALAKVVHAELATG